MSCTNLRVQAANWTFSSLTYARSLSYTRMRSLPSKSSYQLVEWALFTCYLVSPLSTSMQVEGQENAVLGTPLPHPRPRLVLYEHKHLQTSVKTHIDNTLKLQGYRLVADVQHPARVGFHWGDHLYALAE